MKSRQLHHGKKLKNFQRYFEHSLVFKENHKRTQGQKYYYEGMERRSV